MKPKDLKFPFTWEERRPLLHEGVLFVPQHYGAHREWAFSGSHLFTRPAPIYVEYCSGNGAWIIEKAKQHPECNWIAVEKKFERVRKIWSKMRNLSLSNLLIVAGEAALFTRDYLPEGSIAGSYINFPDPWPKEKHAKHRLFKDPFIPDLARVMQKGGTLTVVTDDPLWTGRICHALHASEAWNSLYADPFYVTEWPQYGTSYFDTLWRSQSRTIHYMQFTPL